MNCNNTLSYFVISLENEQLFTKNTLIHKEMRLDRNPTMQLIMSSLLTGYFQVSKTFLVKMSFVCMRIKIIFISLTMHLAVP